MDRKPLGSTALSVSQLGFGASPLGNEFGEIDAAEGIRAVHAAIDNGINFFDTSPFYGRTVSELRLGEALHGKRDQVVVSTKCGRYDFRGFDFSAARIRASIDESLTRLRTDHIDVWQAHDIEFGDLSQIIHETLPAMREIQKQGKVRYLGVTGYQLKMLCNVAAEFPVDVMLSYCRCNLLIDDLDQLLAPIAAAKGIGLINASPLHMGILSNTGAPPWHPAPKAVIDAGFEAAELCRSRGIDIAEVALQHCLAHPAISTTLVGMINVAQVEANVRAAAGTPDPQLILELRALLAPVHNVTWPSGKKENEDYAQSTAD